MSKKAFKSQASSSRAVPGYGFGFGAATASTFTQGPGSTLSYIYEPPDLSGVPATIAVSFKNLQKKDSTTKHKALEDLHLAVQQHENVLDDPFLEAWTQLFPRTAIDNSNRVRQLAYSLHGQVVGICGKKFIKYMPSTVGAWLAGSFDSDRQVSRAAKESLVSTFPTEDKRTGVWKAFQEAILNYCLSAIQNESIQSLSDERTCSPDDAEAKYARAISGALLTTTGSLDTLSESELRKHTEAYGQCLQSDAVWKLASSKDSVLRKAIYRLSISSIEKLRDLIDISKLGNILIRQLSADQSGSISEFISALAHLTKVEPQIWTTLYDGSAKESSIARLDTFLQKGSYSLERQSYKELSTLLEFLPVEILSAEPPSKLLSSLRDGITSSNVGRRDMEFHITEGWRCFLKMADRVLANSSNAEVRGAVVDDAVLAIVKHYIEPGLVEWGRNWPDQKDIALEAYRIAMKYSPESVTKSIDYVSKSLTENMQVSLPEQSKDFAKSQQTVIASFTRWYDFQTAILNGGHTLLDTLSTTASSEARGAMELLKARNSKPYGAAKVLELLVTVVPETSIQQPQLVQLLHKFAKDVIPNSMQSPSAQVYLKLLEYVVPPQEKETILEQALIQVLAAPASTSRSTTLQLLITFHWPNNSQTSDKLVQIILHDLAIAMNGGDSGWQLPFAVFSNTSAPQDLKKQILSSMAQGLSNEGEIEPTIRGFNLLASQRITVLQTFVNSPEGSSLLSTLLHLSHQGDESIRDSSGILKDIIATMVDNGQTNPMVSIIRNSILSTSQTALSISALWTQADAYLKSLPADQRAPAARSLIPDINLWQESLQPLLDQEIHPGRAFIDQFGDAIYLITPATSLPASSSLSYDEAGYAASIRAAIFITKLLMTVKEQFLTPDLATPLYGLLMLASLFASDSVGLVCNVSTYKLSKEHDESILNDTLDDIGRTIASWLADTTQSGSSVMLAVMKNLIRNSHSTSSSAYFYARTYVSFVKQIEEVQGCPKELVADQSVLTRLRRTPQLFTDLAMITSGLQKTGAIKLFNELISDFSPSNTIEHHDSLRQLVTLNILLRNDNMDIDTVPKQRLVYFVKSCTSLLDQNPNPAMLVQTLEVLAKILPALAEIYDEFWESIIQQAISAMNLKGIYQLATVLASLRLFSTLGRMLRGDTNEDLAEAWSNSEPEIVHSQLNFLLSQAHTPLATSQASKIVYELLSLQLPRGVSAITLSEADLYPVLNSQLPVLQRTAYQILDKAIPKSQEQVSLDAALTPDYVPRLPTELFAIISTLPEEDEYQDLKTRPELPPSLSRYLLGWKLVLDHWNQASYKVRAGYVASLKESSHVDDLLSLTFTTLIEDHGGKGKTGFDTSRLASTTDYVINHAEDPEIDFLWLICNIYYNLLLHAPLLVKSWHTNICPRALKSAVETWTSKHMSPLIIAEELDTVFKWKPPTEDPNSELTIKVSFKASEVTASLPLDETSVSIKVHLPASYPLAPMALSTVQRVGVDEKKWQAFLNVSLIVMNFSSTSQGLGATIDGISAWRNNVLAALKGHNECAICYSVVAEDGKVPTKKCATCGHLFHGLCLYKWFQRSAGSSCPLCRNAFNYA